MVNFNNILIKLRRAIFSEKIKALEYIAEEDAIGINFHLKELANFKEVSSKYCLIGYSGTEIIDEDDLNWRDALQTGVSRFISRRADHYQQFKKFGMDTIAERYNLMYNKLKSEYADIFQE